MKKIIRSLTQGALVLSLVVASASCKKEIETVTPVKANAANRIADGVEVHNGRLVFTDMEAFEAYMTEMHAMSIEEIEAADANDGLLSLREHYQQIDGAGEDATVSTDQLFESGALLFVPDSRFASVLNKDGVFQIGDEIHKITQNMEYIIANGDEGILENNDWNNPNVTQFPIAFTTTTEIDTLNGGKVGSSNVGSSKPKSQTARVFNIGPGQSRSRECYWDTNNNNLPKTWNGRPTRMYIIAWNVNYSVYCSFGNRSRFEYKTRYAGWVDNKCDFIKVMGSGSITLNAGTINMSAPISIPGHNTERWGADNADKTMYWTAGKPITVNWLDGYHRAHYKGAVVEAWM